MHCRCGFYLTSCFPTSVEGDVEIAEDVCVDLVAQLCWEAKESGGGLVCEGARLVSQDYIAVSPTNSIHNVGLRVYRHPELFNYSPVKLWCRFLELAVGKDECRLLVSTGGN